MVVAFVYATYLASTTTHMAAAFLAFAHLKKKKRKPRFFVSRPAFTAGAAEAAGAGSILMGR